MVLFFLPYLSEGFAILQFEIIVLRDTELTPGSEVDKIEV